MSRLADCGIRACKVIATRGRGLQLSSLVLEFVSCHVSLPGRIEYVVESGLAAVGKREPIASGIQLAAVVGQVGADGVQHECATVLSHSIDQRCSGHAVNEWAWQ